MVVDIKIFDMLQHHTRNPLSLSSLFSSSNCLRVFVNPLYTRYSFIASSKAPAAEAILSHKIDHKSATKPYMYVHVTCMSYGFLFIRNKQCVPGNFVICLLVMRKGILTSRPRRNCGEKRSCGSTRGQAIPGVI